MYCTYLPIPSSGREDMGPVGVSGQPVGDAPFSFPAHVGFDGQSPSDDAKRPNDTPRDVPLPEPPFETRWCALHDAGEI